MSHDKFKDQEPANLESDFCQEYHDSEVQFGVISMAISILIIAINGLIRAIGQKMIDWVGYHRNEESLLNLTTIIFFCQYVNTAVLIVLATIRLYPDYNKEWFLVVGSQLQQTILIQAFLPYVLFLISWVVQVLKRLLDSGKVTMTHNMTTKKKTKQGFNELYAGPQPKMHLRQAGVMRDVWTAFTHGLAVPTLFPIAMLSILNNYIVEKLCFAYYYKKPPMYDNKFNMRVVTILKLAPLTMLVNAYWLLGNRQMFFNEIYYIDYASDLPSPGHYAFDFTKGINGSLMVLAFIPVFLFLFAGYKKIFNLITKYRFKSFKSAMNSTVTSGKV